MLHKRPEVAQFGVKVPLDDLLADRMVMMQHRFYLPLALLLAEAVATLVPIYCWNEDYITSFGLCIIRIVVVLHHLFTVNSVAHYWGYRPYNRFQKPTENRWVNWISMGESFHNYHHVFAWDYRNSEFDWWEYFNPATLFIEVCILLRLAYEPKKPSSQLIQRVIAHKGTPEYFVDIHRRSLVHRIVLGLLDWAIGLLVAQWPMWIVILYKALSGRPLVVL